MCMHTQTYIAITMGVQLTQPFVTMIYLLQLHTIDVIIFNTAVIIANNFRPISGCGYFSLVREYG